MSLSVEERLVDVRERIAAAARSAGRKPEDITLVGVSKRQPDDRILAALRAGLGHLGENFAQEARDKRDRVRGGLAPDGIEEPRWHFIGQLQRNKARLVAPFFDLVESVDRLSLAKELDKRAAEAGRSLGILVQVSLCDEPQKGGVLPEALPALLDDLAELPNLAVRGLMAVPALGGDAEASRPTFARLRELRERLCSGAGGGTLTELSMGMSGDFEVAIGEGATIVRVGTAIFGPRATRQQENPK